MDNWTWAKIGINVNDLKYFNMNSLRVGVNKQPFLTRI